MINTIHGANLFELSKILNCDINDFLDFSSNINPYGASKKALKKLADNIDMVSIYPDPNYNLLRSNLEKYCNCKKENILLGSGASAFISGYIKLLNPKNSMILEPAYSEYEKELKKINSNIYKYELNESNRFEIDIDLLIKIINDNMIDTIVICNPNNPTGSIIEKNDIEKIIKNTNVNIIVDETYIEFTDISKFSSVSLCENYENIFVIRGTSKYFATPGIRLGYSITSNDKIKKDFEKYYNILWDINIFADIIGQEMFIDYEYHKYIYENITNQRKFIIESLSNIDKLEVYNSYGNFILVKIKDETVNASELYIHLLNKKQIIRDCSNFKGLGKKFFRVCILKDEDNMFLIENIREFFGK